MVRLFGSLVVSCVCVCLLGGCPSADVPTLVPEPGGTGDPIAGGSVDDPNVADTDDGVVADDFSGEFSGDAQKITVYRNKLTHEEAYHLLRRTSFGATEKQVQDAVARGLAKTIDLLLTEQPEKDWVNELAASYEDDVTKRWMVYLLESRNPLYERMAMFWHDRFATSKRVASGWRERSLPVQHYEMIRANALGNYRDFLVELTLDPLMLLWLNGSDSPKENPNENYAREFWELFTLGRDVLYTENDIREGALAFTGIILLYESDEDPRPVFDIYHHDTSAKTIFPDRADPADYDFESVIDLTLAQPEAAEYVARNLFSFFVHDHPSQEVVDELAYVFVANGYEIEPLVRTILTSQALFSSEARGNQITSPVEHYVGVARTLDMHMASEDSRGWYFHRLLEELGDAGQELLNPPSVAGWDEDVAWLEDQWLMQRIEALGYTMEYGSERTEDLPYHLLPPTSGWDRREVRKEIVYAIADAFHLELSEEEEDIYIEVLDQNGHLAFHLLNSDYQPRHVQEMIRLMLMDERVITR